MATGKSKSRHFGFELAALESRRLFATFYVDAGATGTGSGATWANAYPSFESAVGAANLNAGADTILVAGGTYKPTTAFIDPRNVSFQIFDAVTVMGGYAGSASPGTPDARTATTIFSGELGNGETADNAYNILTINTAGAVTVDGLTFKNGNANGTGVNSRGGGIHSFRNDLIVTNCTFDSNLATQGGGIYSQDGRLRVEGSTFTLNGGSEGGGIYLAANTSGPAGANTVSRSTFLINAATSSGGAIFNNLGAAALQIDRSRFNGNLAASRGGAITNATAAPSSIINSIFLQNKTTESGSAGGAIFNTSGAALDVYWSTLTQNQATTGGAIETAGFVATANSIYWANTATDGKSITVKSGGMLRIDYTLAEASVVPVGVTGSGIGLVTGDPLFREPPAPFENGDLRLTSISPAVNAADLLIVAVPVTDFTGGPRVIGTRANLGAIEERVDVTPPSSTIAALPATQTDLAVNLSWTGTDDAEGTGISKYTVFFTDNGSTPAPFVALSNVGANVTSGIFIGATGHTYTFYVVATDVAGNVELAPTTADATILITAVSPPPPPPGNPDTPLPTPTPVPDSDVDLEPGEPTIKRPKEVFGALVGGDTVSGKFKVTNKGGKSVSKKGGSYAIYLSGDETVSSQDQLVATIQFKKGLSVKGKGSITVSYKIDLPTNYTGTGNLLARVNAPGDGSATEVGETDTSNNTVNLGSVNVAAPFTNLSAPNTITPPANATAGSSRPLFATFTIRNRSNTTFSDIITVRSSLGTDGTTVTTRKKVTIKPGGTKVIKVLIRSPDTAGSYTLTTTLDPDNVFSQTEITDDTVTTPVTFS